MADTAEKTSGIVFYGAGWCGDCRRSRALLDGLGVDYSYNDVEHDAAATERAREISGGTHIPVIHFPDGAVQVEPSDPELSAKLTELGIAG